MRGKHYFPFMKRLLFMLLLASCTDDSSTPGPVDTTDSLLLNNPAETLYHRADTDDHNRGNVSTATLDSAGRTVLPATGKNPYFDSTEQ